MEQSSPEPATYFQVDKTTFRELVQKLTGASSDSTNNPPLIRNPSTSPKGYRHFDTTHVRQSQFKLQERRQKTVMRKMEIKLGPKAAGGSVGQPNSPGCPLTPVHSPMTPLACDSMVSARVGAESPPSEEERAISEKGFYLHPSPRKPEPPELLTLFPLTSPR